jgi:predicted ATP-dependent endonuclease of OLD family
MSKVQRIEVINFKGLDSISSNLDGRSVYIVGGNEAGKSSFIDAVFTGLTGENIPPEPIKRGKKEAKIEIDLGDGLAVVVEFNKVASGETKRKLSLIVDGEKVKDAPASRLKDIVKTISFDPFEFMAKSPKEKLDYFCKIAGLNTTEIDAEYRDNLDLIAVETRELKKHELTPFDQTLVDKEEVDSLEVINRLRALEDKNRKITDFEAKVKALELENVDITEQIQVLIDKIAKNKELIEKGKAWLETNVVAPTTDIEAELANLDATNKAIREAKEAKRKNEDRTKRQENIDLATEANKKLRSKKEALISDALAGIDGLTFDDENGFLLNGLPFNESQNNTASQIIAGLKIGLKMLGEVRVARFDGSLLDDKHLEEVKAWADSQDLQLFIEIVDRESSALRLEIIDNE